MSLRQLQLASVVTVLIIVLASCEGAPRDVRFCECPAVTVANGSVYVVGFKLGRATKPFGMRKSTQPFDKLYTLQGSLRSGKWERRTIPVPNDVRDLGPYQFMPVPFSASFAAGDELVLLFGAQYRHPDPNPVLVISGRTESASVIYPPWPYTEFEGAVSANGKVYAVTEPLYKDTGPLREEGKPASTLLLETTMTGQVLRKLEIKICDPVLHENGALNDFLPMAAVGDELFILENPGITSEIPGKAHPVEGALQVLDLKKLAVKRRIAPPESDDQYVWDYYLFADQKELYVMAAVGIPEVRYKIFRYNTAKGKLQFLAEIPADAERGLTPSAFAVMDDSVYFLLSPRELLDLIYPSAGTEPESPFREVGRIENTPAK